MKSLLVHPQKTPLVGRLSVPGDKSISHRAAMLSAMAKGRSAINNWLPAGDTKATLDAVKSLGVHINVTPRSTQSWDLIVEGQGLFSLKAPAGPLDCRNAGTCMRLLAGILVGQPFRSVLDGSRQLRLRPMARIIHPLREMGALIESEDNRAPLVISPAELQGIEYEMPMASAQVKSAIILAALYASGETWIFQPGPSRDHTERMLKAMGAGLSIRDNWIGVPSMKESVSGLDPLDMLVPGDISSAAFPLVAAAVVPYSKITIENTGLNETRTGLLDILYTMGANIELKRLPDSGGEPLADLSIVFDELHSSEVEGDLVVRAIDEFPIWAVAATQAAGDSLLREASELRLKEVDRISLLKEELTKMGAIIGEYPDGLKISGPTRLTGAEVDSHGDHRLGMALVVAGLVANSPTVVHQAGCIADSFPGFVETMTALGARIEIRD